MSVVWHFWRDWAIKRDYRRCTAVFISGCEALARRDMAKWHELKAEHARLCREFKARWGYTVSK